MISNPKEYFNLVSEFDRYKEHVKPNVYFLGLIGEIGELCLVLSNVNIFENKENEWKESAKSEIGDIYWYWFGLANRLNLDYEKIWNITYNDYKKAKPDNGEILEIVGTAGRIIEHLKKAYRDDDGVITLKRKTLIEEKMINVLQLLFNFCKSVDLDPYEALQSNYNKLSARNKAGTLQGEGDGISKEERT